VASIQKIILDSSIYLWFLKIIWSIQAIYEFNAVYSLQKRYFVIAAKSEQEHLQPLIL